MSQKAMLVERKACCYVVNTVLSRLQLHVIWLISRLKMSKMSKNGFLFFWKRYESQWVKTAADICRILVLCVDRN